METCGILTDDPMLTGHFYPRESIECVRPEGHAGEHLYRDHEGKYIATCLDLLCDCVGCQSDDTCDWCEIYCEVSLQDANRLLADKDHTIGL